VYPKARVDPESFARNLPSPTSGHAVQFERIGYFVRDKDSTDQRTVLNQVVPLRESSAAVVQSDNDANATRRDAQAAQLAAKKEKMKIAPQEMFRLQPELYGQFDAEGLPTHDAAGVALTKSAMKKLKKDQDKQKKLHDAYLKEQ
jgi:glutaminyl-tRNA synthetase